MIRSRTRVVGDELDGGRWVRASRTPDRGLGPLLARDCVGFAQEGARTERWLEPPQPAVTLIVSLEGELHAGGAVLPRAWVSGLSDTYDVVEFEGGYAALDFKLTPLGAYTLLGRPLHELAGAVVAVDDVLGPGGRQLTERLLDAQDWERRFDVLETFLAQRASAGPRPTPEVAWAWCRLRRTAGRAQVGQLAAELGCSRRHLSARFREQVGQPPKTVARLLRFEHVRRQLAAEPVRWADIAYECGYCDQSHLSRDFRELAGTTPSAFLERQMPGAGDEVTFVQDRA